MLYINQFGYFNWFNLDFLISEITIIICFAGKEYPPYEPTWFNREKDEQNNSYIYRYKGDYWECKEKQDWSRCPDIF